jgi:hypothetical protein
MYALDDAVRFQHEISFASGYFDYRAVVACTRKDSSGSPTRKIKQDLVEESVFAQSA